MELENRRYGIHPAPQQTPDFFRELTAAGSLTADAIFRTADGFCAAAVSLADILTGRGIVTVPDSQDQALACDRFFDDWYLYAVPGADGPVYSLFKMREQEHDAENGALADGDTPGVTVSFIAFDTAVLHRCLTAPDYANRKAVNREINRVVAHRGQRHHAALKAYFLRPEAEGAYLIAELYVRFLAGLAQDHALPVPEAYAAQYRAGRAAGASRKAERLPRFLDENNAAAGYTVCDHAMIRIRDAAHLSVHEKYALLATHTADTSFHAFAAEVRFHARFLTWYARIPIPFLGKSVYASAIRADLTIDETELEGPTPYHNPRSRWIRQQERCHGAYGNSETA